MHLKIWSIFKNQSHHFDSKRITLILKVGKTKNSKLQIFMKKYIIRNFRANMINSRIGFEQKDNTILDKIHTNKAKSETYKIEAQIFFESRNFRRE